MVILLDNSLSTALFLCTAECKGFYGTINFRVCLFWSRNGHLNGTRTRFE